MRGICIVSGLVIVAIVLATRKLSAAQSDDAPDASAPSDPSESMTIIFTPPVRVLAEAIAYAEGFGLPGAVPTRAHNPGDLKIPGWTGAKTGVEGISVFESDYDGWMHLYQQLERIRTGNSSVYTTEMSFQDMADKWTDTAQAPWAQNVVTYLNRHGFPYLSLDSALSEVLY